jgi:hypothetical protein
MSNFVYHAENYHLKFITFLQDLNTVFTEEKYEYST